MSRLGTGAVKHARGRSRAISLGIAMLLALASVVGLGQAAVAATPGISSSVLLNGTTYNGTDVVNEGDTLTLRVQYNTDVVPGSTVVFDLGPNVTVTGVPGGNTAIASVTQAPGNPNQVSVTFQDPWPAGVNQGVFDLKFKVNDVDASVKEPITWKVDGDEQSIDVIIRNTGDQFANVADGSAKSVSPTNLNSYVSVNAAGDTVTVNPTIANADLTYKLTLNSPTARTGFTIADQLPSYLDYVTGSFSAQLTKWDADGLNRTSAPFTYSPTVTGDSFTSSVDVPGPSILEITYKARVTDVSGLQAALQAALTAHGTGAGNFSIPLENTASFGGTDKKAIVTVQGTVAGVNIGQAFTKTSDWSSKNVVTDASGNLTPPAEITYTLGADLTRWNGSGPNFTLSRNVVISDVLPSQASWKTGAGFITATGIILTQASAPCPDQATFAGDAYVGQYCVDGQTLLVNVGKDNTKTVSIQAKAQVDTITGLTQAGSTTVKDAVPYRLRNQADFYYRSGGAYQATRDVTVVELPDSSEGLNDTSVFTKAGTPRDTTIDPGQSVTVDYVFKVAAGKGIDARTSKIVDYIDPAIFDLGTDNANVVITGTYDGQALDATHFTLGNDAQGNLVIELSAAGKALVDTRGADKAWQVNVTLVTKPFVGKETKQIKNKATLFGEDGDPLYWSETGSEATSYGDEAEVRKRVYDRSAANPDERWTDTLKVQTNAAGELVQDTFVYRVEFIPHGSYNNVVIVPVKDLLPSTAQFLGFVTEANAPTAANPVAGPVDIGGNLQGSYDAGTTTVTLAQKSGTKLQAGNPIAAYFAVKVTDAEDATVNKIGSTEATIVPQDPPSVDIEKWTDEGAGSGPTYDAFGNLTNDGYLGDFDDTDPGTAIDDPKGLDAGQSQAVRFTISNDGGEALKDVKVTDTLVSGEKAVTGLSCVFPGGAIGTEWAGPLQPGARFECTGTMAGLDAGKTHHDRAKVVGTGVVSEDEVDDEDDWNAFAKSYAVGDYVWIDTDRDGIQDDSEVLPGVKVELLDENGDVLDTQTTDPQGRYLFDDLPGGTYQVRFTLTEEQAKIYQFTGQDAGSDDKVDSDADRATGLTRQFVLDDDNDQLVEDYDRPFNATQGVDPTWDAGVNLKSVSVGDYVWVDTDRDGRQDAGEPGIPGVVLKLVGPDGQPVTDVYGDPVEPVTTDAGGKYTFEDLPALVDGQTYKVVIDQTASAQALKPYVPTKPAMGDRAGDSSTWEASTVPGDLHEDGDRDPTLDFGFVTKSYAIGDYVWIDKNDDGIQGAKEKPLAGVKVELLKDGKVVGTTVTDKSGHYLFDNLPAGTYQVKFTLTKAQKKQYKFTSRDSGANDGRDSDATAGGLTTTFVLDDSNTALTTVYGFHTIQATQGIDPTWDAGVIEKGSAGAAAPGSGLPGLPNTGNPIGWQVIAAALALVGAGGVLIGVGRKRRSSQGI